MNWEAIGAIGEMVGALGVVVSLVYLASQIGRLLRVAEGLHSQYSEGRMDPKTWHGMERSLIDLSRFPGLKAIWPTRSHWYSDDFVAFMKPFIESSEPQQLFPD